MTGTLTGIPSITGSLTSVAQISGSLAGTVTITGALTIPTYFDVDTYDGEYEFTPSTETQTISSTNKTMTQDIIINPIPSNYGLISWNGTVLTVS